MADRNYFVLCADNCKYPALTKEQTLTAIQQAIETGEIKDVDTGFITTIKERNHGAPLSFWIGTQAEYNAIENKAADCFYIISDDEAEAEMSEAISQLEKKIEAVNIKKGVPAQIVVTTRGGAVRCTNAAGKDITGAGIDDVWTFDVYEYGVYIITGNYGGVIRSKEVEVKEVKQHEITLEFYDNTFSENPWETIIEVCQRGICPPEWSVGDSKDGVKIIGKQHDVFEDGTKASLTLLLDTGETQIMHGVWESEGADYGYTSTNEGGWEESRMRSRYLPEFMTDNEFLAQYGEYIRAVKKTTSAGNMSSDIVTTADQLFIASEIEIMGSCGYSFAGEGTQYEYYANGNLVNANGNIYFWTRSPYNANATDYVSMHKHYDYNRNESENDKSAVKHRVSVCFCF